MTDASSESPSAPADPAARPRLAGVIARWLGAALVLASILSALTGLPGGAPMFLGGILLLAAGLGFAILDRRAWPDGSARPPPSPGLAAMIMVMAAASFLVGAGRTMGSAPSSSADFLVEKVALAVSFALIVLGVIAFAEPRRRPACALIGLLAFAALFLFNMLAG